MTTINQHWTDKEGNPSGGISAGIGYTISWQRGSLTQEGRNGAFLTDVLESLRLHLEHVNNVPGFHCPENEEALAGLESALLSLTMRRDRRQLEGKLGTHIPEVK